VPSAVEPEFPQQDRLLDRGCNEQANQYRAADQARRHHRRPIVIAYMLTLLAGWAAVLGLMALIALAGARIAHRIDSLTALRAGIADVEEYANRRYR
jgi:hypothetical protein